MLVFLEIIFVLWLSHLQKLLEIFSDYAFLWLQDVNITFEEFLRGNLTPNPLRSPNRALAGSIRQQMAERSRSASRSVCCWTESCYISFVLGKLGLMHA